MRGPTSSRKSTQLSSFWTIARFYRVGSLLMNFCDTASSPQLSHSLQIQKKMVDSCKMNHVASFGGEMEDIYTQLLEEIDDRSACDESIRNDIAFIDPASFLFEITFGFKPEKLMESDGKAPISNTGFNPIIHIWM